MGIRHAASDRPRPRQHRDNEADRQAVGRPRGPGPGVPPITSKTSACRRCVRLRLRLLTGALGTAGRLDPAADMDVLTNLFAGWLQQMLRVDELDLGPLAAGAE